MDEGLLQTLQQDPMLPKHASQLLSGDTGRLCAGPEEKELGLKFETTGYAADNPPRTRVFNKMPITEPSEYISARAFARVFKQVNKVALQALQD